MGNQLSWRGFALPVTLPPDFRTLADTPVVAVGFAFEELIKCHLFRLRIPFASV